MKFTINKLDIVDILSKIQGITNRRSSLAITETVLIKTTNEGIHITATDLETVFEGVYPAIIEDTGVIAINAKKLFEIVKEFPHDQIIIKEVDNRWIELGNRNIQYHIVGMNPDDFPESPFMEDIHFYSISSGIFKKLIERATVISGMGDDKRAHINGIFFEKVNEGENGKIQMASTDGSRLSVVSHFVDNPSELKVDDSILIPKKGLIELAKFLESEGNIEIGHKDSYIIFKKQNYETIFIRLLNGDFPKYESIIQKDPEFDILLEKQKFIKMLKRMAILSSESYRGAIFNFEDNSLTITATNPDIGEAKEDMPIIYEKEKVAAAFNPRYFIETLNAIESENVIINVTAGDRPCLLHGEDKLFYLTVIMPMKI